MPLIMIVEDNEQTRQGLADGLNGQPDMHLAAAVGNVADALQILQSDTRIDVLLVDLGLPDGSGVDVIRQAVTRREPPEIMVITVFGDEQHVVSAIEAGATGYLLKDDDAGNIADAINQLLDGGSPITPVVARHILKRFKIGHAGPAEALPAPAGEPRPDGEVPQLTPRETEVLHLVARGYTNSEIGDLFSVSFHTINSHVKHIYRKLSVRSRSEAVFEASQLGLIDLNDGR